jgi:DNA ligase D-like protein (predicted ligase)
MLDQRLPPMLATIGRCFDSAAHLFEVKWDGIRMLAFVGGDTVRLQNRKLTDETARYPEVVAALKRLPGEFILDGEVVVFEGGRPRFEKVLERELVASAELIARRSQSLPATYVAFDILFQDGRRLLEEPLSRRKTMLEALFDERVNDALLPTPWVREHGRAYFEEAVARGLEGVVAKALESPYLPGKRTRYWIKAKAQRAVELAVLGMVREAGSGRVRSLVLGACRQSGWVWLGNVGSGLDEKTLKALATDLEPLAGEKPPGFEAVGGGEIYWLKPALVARVKYLELTNQGRLRAPVFLGWVDQRPETCTGP